MKKFISTILLLAISAIVFSHTETVHFKVKVLNEKESPLGVATVKVLKASTSTEWTHAVTNSDGVCNLTIENYQHEKVSIIAVSKNGFVEKIENISLSEGALINISINTVNGATLAKDGKTIVLPAMVATEEVVRTSNTEKVVKDSKLKEEDWGKDKAKHEEDIKKVKEAEAVGEGGEVISEKELKQQAKEAKAKEKELKRQQKAEAKAAKLEASRLKTIEKTEKNISKLDSKIISYEKSSSKIDSKLKGVESDYLKLEQKKLKAKDEAAEMKIDSKKLKLDGKKLDLKADKKNLEGRIKNAKAEKALLQKKLENLKSN